MDDTVKYKFWRAVEECLVQFHTKDRAEAQKKVLEVQQKLREGPEGLIYEMVFHMEPFDLACALMGTQVRLSDDEYRETYVRQILEVAR